MSERYINNLTGDFSICFSEHLTEHPNNYISDSYHRELLILRLTRFRIVLQEW